MSMKNSVATDRYSVSDEIAAMRALASAGLIVHPERCVRLRNRHATCNRCAQACTSGAIDIKENAWSLDPSLCVQCGTCATVCPTCALEASHPHDADLLRAARKNAAAMQDIACFACSKALEENQGLVRTANVVELTCLSRLDETIIFTLLSSGVGRVVAVRGQCSQCPRSQGRISAELVEETVAAISRAWGLEARYCRTDAFPAAFLRQEGDEERPVSSAREDRAECCQVSDTAVFDVSDAGQVRARLKPAHVQGDGTLPHFVPQRRRKLLDALAKCGSPVQEVVDTRLWGHVLIDFDRCKSCKMCAVFCPTGALSKYVERGTTDVERGVMDAERSTADAERGAADAERGEQGIEHYVAECVHCCLCQDICPGHAITCVTQVPAMQLALGSTERYCMPDPDWMAGPDQILQRMRVKIGGNSVEHSY